MPIDLWLISAAKAVVEIAGLALLAQGVVGFLSGARRENNGVYRLLRVVTRPATRLVRWFTPRLVVDAHIPAVTFFVLVWLWFLLIYAKYQSCLSHGLNCTR